MKEGNTENAGKEIYLHKYTSILKHNIIMKKEKEL